jgi:hypothetical protein
MSTIFTDGTLYSMNKLDMINTCLLAIGEVPFPAGTLVENFETGTDGDVARREVENTMIEVQNRGWYFNTDYNFPLVPDSDNFITMSPNTLRVDFGSTSNRGKYIMRSKRIYNREDFTYKITEQLLADVMWLVDYEELPPAAFNYIALRAARKFQQKVIGSTELAGFTQLDENDAFIAMQREHMQYQDYNIIPSRMNRRTNAFLVGGLYG